MSGDQEPRDDPRNEPRNDVALTILLYASDRLTRQNVRLALGRKVAADLPPVRVLEVATQAAVITAMDAGGIDLAILDGEAVPGGMGLCRQLKDEIVRCPPVLVLIGRTDDAWLATWSRADGAVSHPVDPIRLPAAVAALLRPLVSPPQLSTETTVARTTSAT
jgi:DNA-binding response OmpR family regulator